MTDIRARRSRRRRHPYRRRLQAQSRPRRVGRGAAPWRARPRDVRRRARRDQQQPHGVDRADHGAGGAHQTGGGAPLHRQHLRPQRHHQVGARLGAQRLADRREAAGEECRPLAAAPGGLRARTRSSGSGSRVTPGSPTTSWPTSWRPAVCWKRSTAATPGSPDSDPCPGAIRANSVGAAGRPTSTRCTGLRRPGSASRTSRPWRLDRKALR